MDQPPHEATLRLVTTNPQPDRVIEADPCDGSYTCECPACRAEVDRRVRIGVRATRTPLKRAA